MRVPILELLPGPEYWYPPILFFLDIHGIYGSFYHFSRPRPRTRPVPWLTPALYAECRCAPFFLPGLTEHHNKPRSNKFVYLKIPSLFSPLVNPPIFHPSSIIPAEASSAQLPHPILSPSLDINNVQPCRQKQRFHDGFVHR